MDSDIPNHYFANEDHVLIHRFTNQIKFNGFAPSDDEATNPFNLRQPFGEKKELYYFPEFAYKVGKPQFNVAAPLGDFGSVHLNGEWNDRILEWDLGPAFPGAVGNVLLQYKLGYGKVELAGATVGIEKTDYDNYARIKLIKTYLGEVRIDHSPPDQFDKPKITLTFNGPTGGLLTECTLSGEFESDELKATVVYEEGPDSGKTVVLSVNSDNEQSYKISDLGGEQFRLEGNCDTPINLKSNGNPAAGITQYKIFDEGVEVAEYFQGDRIEV